MVSDEGQLKPPSAKKRYLEHNMLKVTVSFELLYFAFHGLKKLLWTN